MSPTYGIVNGLLNGRIVVRFHLLSTGDGLVISDITICPAGGWPDQPIGWSDILALSRAIGEYIYHPAGANAAIRNGVMSGMKPSEYYDRLAWLYGGTGIGETAP